MNCRTPVSLSLLFACLLTSTIRSQSQVVSQPVQPQAWAWPAAYGAGSFQKIAAADVTGDRMVDVCVLRGSRAYVSASTEVMACFAPIGTMTGITDLAVVTRVNNGVPERSMAIAAAGGVLYGSFVQNGQMDWIPTGGSWPPVLRLVTTPSATGAHIAAVTIDRTAVAIGHWTPQGGVQYVRTIARSTTSPVNQVAFVNVLAGGDPEVVLLEDAGLELAPLSGYAAPLLASPRITMRGFLAAVAVAPDRDQIAWLTPAPAPAQSWLLQIVDDTGLRHSHPLVLPAPIPAATMVTGMCANDIDGDGSVDLLFSQDSTPHMAVIVGSGAQDPLASPAPTAFLIACSGAPGGNLCGAVLTDVNRDGSLDPVICRDSDGSVGTLSVGLSAANTLRLTRGDSGGGDEYPTILTDQGQVVLVDANNSTDPADWRLRLDLTLTAAMVAPGVQIEVTVYHQAVVGGVGEDVKVIAESTLLFQPQGFRTRIEVPLAAPISAETGQGFEWQNDDHYYFKISFPALTHGSPSYLMGFASSEIGLPLGQTGAYLYSIAYGGPEDEKPTSGYDRQHNRLIGLVLRRRLRIPVELGSVPVSPSVQSGTSSAW